MILYVIRFFVSNYEIYNKIGICIGDGIDFPNYENESSGGGR